MLIGYCKWSNEIKLGGRLLKFRGFVVVRRLSGLSDQRHYLFIYKKNSDSYIASLKRLTLKSFAIEEMPSHARKY